MSLIERAADKLVKNDMHGFMPGDMSQHDFHDGVDPGPLFLSDGAPGKRIEHSRSTKEEAGTDLINKTVITKRTVKKSKLIWKICIARVLSRFITLNLKLRSSFG